MSNEFMTGFDLYSNLITLFCGIYCLYTGIKLKKLGRLFPNQLLLPKDTKPEDCLDPEGFIEYIFPRLLVVGVTCTLVGIVCLAVSRLSLAAQYFPQIPDLEFYVTMTGIVLSIASLGWFMACWVKAKKLYWV